MIWGNHDGANVDCGLLSYDTPPTRRWLQYQRNLLLLSSDTVLFEDVLIFNCNTFPCIFSQNYIKSFLMFTIRHTYPMPGNHSTEISPTDGLNVVSIYKNTRVYFHYPYLYCTTWNKYGIILLTCIRCETKYLQKNHIK